MARATPYSDKTQCIELCLDCYRNCIDTAVTHCLEADGEYAGPAYFRLCGQCAANCAALDAEDRPHHRTTQLEPVLTHPRARP